MIDFVFVFLFIALVTYISKYDPVEDAVTYFQTGDYIKSTVKWMEVVILTCLQVLVAKLILAIITLVLQ
jgi:hypothetical protein